MKTLQVMGDSAYGGGTVLLSAWCKYLQQRGCMVDVIATDKKTIEVLSTIPGINIIDSIYIPRNIKLLRDLAAFINIAKLNLSKRYDVVHTYTATPGFVGRVAAWMTGAKVILHHQAAWAFSEATNSITKFLYLIIETVPSLVSTTNICVGKSVANEAKQIGFIPERKLSVIRNGIDPSPYLQNKAVNNKEYFKSNEDAIVIGATGRLAPLKDYNTLIYAIKYVLTKKNHLPIKLLICGEGSEHETLKNTVSYLGLDNNVSFLGFQKDIPLFLSGVDIYVSPTLREGLSISILEAMAAGLPIVVSSIPPNMELIENGINGLVFPPQDPEALGEALIRFIESPELAESCGKAAKKKALEEFTIDRMFDETFQLYVNLLKTSSGKRKLVLLELLLKFGK